MLTETFVLTDGLGLHARPAAALAMGLAGLDAAVTLLFRGMEADGRDMMEVMGLGASGGDAVTVTALGPEEEKAMRTVRGVFAALGNGTGWIV